MENILPLSIFLVNLAPSSRIFNQARPKSNPLPHSESQSSTSRKSTRLAVIFALSFTAVATLRLCSVCTMPGPTMPRRRRVGRMGRFGIRKSNLLVQQWLQEGYSFCVLGVGCELFMQMVPRHCYKLLHVRHIGGNGAV
ncbi:hypothetical protein C1H46_036973 [Malus baccata]|uniref:Uncharacterized protein n=1 Tax=Malus baccata TaxID=106549 RepID=A0A540KU05_MALBA|nr:hypothetical protein C1H46_036973 [Malus baccata]